ncbi:hypothetical protein DE146DRAFT_603321 [Phaeosphaeria sp. MPI-PUGE-AT-0046c]|nr:hypothetical protein DE146DRAFT_603321 [Phaeosphaeria sp. MPI-PUGE-AT-0046c]
MPSQQMPKKRAVPDSASSINSLIAAANLNDRFHLLEDDHVPAANLDNALHPIFRWFDRDGPLKQMLRLASQFLAHDSVLIFFVPLLYGHDLTINTSNTTKPYLSDPLKGASDAHQKVLIDGVRRSLLCLAHSIEFRFMKPEKRQELTTVIELTDHFMHYYSSDDGYSTASRCAQFRHDFLFASTIIHEIVHAVGVMRRGNLSEPYIRRDDPDPEWGYAWEHFMFGCIINPQDRTRPGTYAFMRKMWANTLVAEEAGGKEYCDVPMSYIAQWFQKQIWHTIAQQGPTAIAPPVTHFKVQSSLKYGAWIISTDCMDIKEDLLTLHRKWKHQSRVLSADGRRKAPASRILWRFQTTEALQKSNVHTPPRISWQTQDRPSDTSSDTRTAASTSVSSSMKTSVCVCQIASAESSRNKRKRKASSVPGSPRTTKVSTLDHISP